MSSYVFEVMLITVLAFVFVVLPARAIISTLRRRKK